MIGICNRFGALPDAGGVLDQDASFVRMLAIYDLAHGESGGNEQRLNANDDDVIGQYAAELGDDFEWPEIG